MALDSRLALGAQGVDGLAMFDNSQKIASVLDQNKTQNEFRRLYEMSKGDLGQMAANAQNSKLFAMVMPQIQAQQAAVAKAALDGQKTQAEIGKFNAGATKDYADAGKTMQAVTVDKQRQQASALAAAMQGDARAADFSLQLAEQGGQIDATTAAQARKFIVDNANNPQAIASMVKSLAIQAAEKPSEYITPDANNTNTNATSITNNKLDNQTSRLNNTANNQTSMRGQDITANTQAQKLAVDQQQFAQQQIIKEQELALKQNEGTLMTGSDGKQYIYYKNQNRAELFQGSNGVALKPITGKSVETQIQRMERLVKVQSYAAAADSAASASQFAADLASDKNGLDSAAGEYGLMAKVPGSDAKTFATKLDTLKSRVFLTEIEKMRGMGSLTEAEGAKLTTSIASLDLSLEPAALQSNLTEIARILAKAAEKSKNMTLIYAGKDPTSTSSPPPSNSLKGAKPDAKSFFE